MTRYALVGCLCALALLSSASAQFGQDFFNGFGTIGNVGQGFFGNGQLRQGFDLGDRRAEFFDIAQRDAQQAALSEDAASKDEVVSSAGARESLADKISAKDLLQAQNLAAAQDYSDLDVAAKKAFKNKFAIQFVDENYYDDDALIDYNAGKNIKAQNNFAAADDFDFASFANADLFANDARQSADAAKVQAAAEAQRNDRQNAAAQNEFFLDADNLFANRFSNQEQARFGQGFDFGNNLGVGNFFGGR